MTQDLWFNAPIPLVSKPSDESKKARTIKLMLCNNPEAANQDEHEKKVTTFVRELYCHFQQDSTEEICRFCAAYGRLQHGSLNWQQISQRWRTSTNERRVSDHGSHSILSGPNNSQTIHWQHTECILSWLSEGNNRWAIRCSEMLLLIYQKGQSSFAGWWPISAELWYWICAPHAAVHNNTNPALGDWFANGCTCAWSATSRGLSWCHQLRRWWQDNWRVVWTQHCCQK